MCVCVCVLFVVSGLVCVGTACSQPICKSKELKIERIICIVTMDSDLEIIIVPAMRQELPVFF